MSMFNAVAVTIATAALSSIALAQQPLPELDVPYVTSPENVVDAMLGLARVKASDFILDLGSGDGRIVIKAAEAHGARGMGVEIDPKLVALSNENATKAGVADRARFVQQDLFETDLTTATVITMYLLPDVNLKLRPSLLKLKAGTRIVSHDWDMGDWEPNEKVVLDVPDKKIGFRKQSTLMLWKVPADVAGEWRAGRHLKLELTQRYQNLAGSVSYRRRVYDAATGRVDGTRVHLCFAADAAGRCSFGALGDLVAGRLRLLIDGAGRAQLRVIASRAPSKL